MNQTHVQLNLDLNAFLGDPSPTNDIQKLLGLTPWFKTMDDEPPYVGWWKVYVENGAERRRHWNGFTWSAIVTPGMPAEMVEIQRETRLSIEKSQHVIWCGLRKPHIVPYLEPLMKSERAERLMGTYHD